MAINERKKAISRKNAKKDKNPSATLRGLAMSARKVRVIANMVRGKKVNDAFGMLVTQRRAASFPIKKLLDSAVANAGLKNMNSENLVIGKIDVDKGPITRRHMPRAQGRATRIRKQSSHIKIELREI